MAKTLEELERAYREWMATPIPKAKPKPVEGTVAFSPKLAQAAKANPESVRVRVTAKAPDDTVVVDLPRRPQELVEVLSVDSAGRPARVRRYETATGEWSIVEYEQGYRQPPGAAHEYDPLRGLRRDGE
jgi:hypothetical protein